MILTLSPTNEVCAVGDPKKPQRVRLFKGHTEAGVPVVAYVWALLPEGDTPTQALLPELLAREGRAWPVLVEADPRGQQGLLFGE